MIQSFLNYLQYEKRCSSHTILSYKTDLQQFLTYCQQNSTIEEEDFCLEKVPYETIRAWVVSLVEAGTNPNSINRKIAAINSFFKSSLQFEGVYLLQIGS